MSVGFCVANATMQHRTFEGIEPDQVCKDQITWIAPGSGVVGIDLMLEVPDEKSNVIVFRGRIVAKIHSRSIGPQAIHVHQNIEGGSHEVGDKKVIGLDMAQAAARDERPSYLSPDETPEEPWLMIVLSEDKAMSVRRSRELRLERDTARFQECLSDARRLMRGSKIHQRSDPAAAEAALGRLKSAERKIAEAHQLADEVLKKEGLIEECVVLQRELEEQIAQFAPPESPPFPCVGRPESGGILRRTDATPIEVWLIPKREVSWGRSQNDNDVPLAVEPYLDPPGAAPSAEVQRNYMRSTDLSRRHFITSWQANGLCVEDQSKRGTWLERHGERHQLGRQVPTVLANGDRLHLAPSPTGDDPVLSLEIVFPELGLRKSHVGEHLAGGYVGCSADAPKSVVVRRLNNIPERLYVLLRSETSLGRNPDSGIVLEGEGVHDQHAMIVLANGQLAVRRLGDGYVAVNGQEVPRGGTVPLPDKAELRFGKVPMEFEWVQSAEKAGT